MALRGVLFDFDGTLADTARAEREGWDALAAVVEQHVPELDREELHQRYSSAFEPYWTDYLEGRIDFGRYRWNRLRDAISPWAELDDGLFEVYRSEKRLGVSGSSTPPCRRSARCAGMGCAPGCSRTALRSSSATSWR